MPNIKIPEGLLYEVDEEYYGRSFDPNKQEHLTEQIINGYLTLMMVAYRQDYRRNERLWDALHEDCEGFTLETFSMAHRFALRALREHLVMNGVWVRPAKGSISYAKALYDCYLEESPAEWTEERLKEAEEIRIKQSQSVQTPAIQASPLQCEPTAQIRTTQTTAGILPGITPQSQLTPQLIKPTAIQPYGSISKMLTELAKLYSDSEKKFGGEIYDILNTKLRIFYDYCQKIGIGADQYASAYSIMLKGRAADFYYDRLVGKGYDFNRMIFETRCHFETEESKQQYLTEWRETTLARIITANPGISRLECLQKLFDRLQNIQRGLSESYQEDLSLRDQVINACRGIEECNLALFNPANTYEGVCAQLRSAIGTAVRSREAQQFNTYPSHPLPNVQQPSVYSSPQPSACSSPYSTPENSEFASQYDHNWTDRTYGGRRGGSRGFSRGRGNYRPNIQARQKKCYVCDKSNCWSTRHSLQERKEAFNKFRQSAIRTGTRSDTAYFQSFLAQYEGLENLEDNDVNETEELLRTMEIEDYPAEQYLTEFGNVEGTCTVAVLNDQSALHSITRSDIFNEPQTHKPQIREIFSFDDRYSEQIFHGIMPDTGAAGVSTAGESQVRALQRLDDSIKIDKSTAGEHTIRFGKGTAVSLGTVRVQTPLGLITFCVVPTNTPFLLCIEDMDKLGVKLDNLHNLLVQGEKRVPVIRKWGHPWLLLNQREKSIAWSHLTEVELRQLHRRFGHPSVRRLLRILQRAGQEVEKKAIKHLTKYCHHCQMNQNSPGRFKFSLKDDFDFNFSVIVDVLYLNGKPVLQVVDSATSFQAARFLKDMSARNAWDTLRICWIDVYLGPPDQLVHDAGKNFSSAEFRQHAKTLAIDVKEVPVEAHNSVGKVERYHAPLRRAFDIISIELRDASEDLVLQMAVKAINDSAGPDGLVPTLLVFGAYPRMTEDSPPSPSITQRAEAVRKAMKEVQRLYAARRVKDALGMRNGPNVLPILTLPIQSDVRVWREKDGWSGPFKLIAMDGHTCTVQMPYGPTQFRSTVVRPYYKENLEQVSTPNNPPKESPNNNNPEEQKYDSDTIVIERPQPRRGRGRPKGSRNRPKPAEQSIDFDEQFVSAIQDERELTMTFMTAKEEADLNLAKQLRLEGRITTPGAPFEASGKHEIESLIARGVFQIEQYDPTKFRGIRIFKSRMVNEIKGKATNAPFEKSRLVIQGYNDDGKEVILTQSPTIQRASQRIIMALAPSLIKDGMAMHLRDITQAYTQSETQLNRLILAQLPEQIRNEHPEDTVMRILKPLYGIAEAGTHWWATYSKHHKERLSMITSTFDPCLLITSAATGSNPFGIVGMQTDDTLLLGDKAFEDLEEDELAKAKLSAKPKQKLDVNTPLLFNGCILTIEGETCCIRQKDQGKKIDIIKDAGPDGEQQATQQQVVQQYIEQRARGAYVASICQPEASFDLSIAAQHQEPTKEDIAALNKRLLWQMNNLRRGLTYIPIDLSAAKLFVFVDGSFANNKDFSSQLGYKIILANEDSRDDTFIITGNLIHWSSTKSKRITRSVLASEIYGMVGGVDMAIAIGTTLQMITDRLNLPVIPLIVCTDSYSLYECLVKLGTTKEKRLMIDIMALRQSYERREVFEIRWINGQDNPADAMTKVNPNQALTTFVDTNQLQVRVEGWVKRG